MLEARVDEHDEIKLKTLRQFACLSLLICLGMAAWQGVTHGRLAASVALSVLGLVIGVRGMVKPATVETLFRFLTALTLPIGLVVTRVLVSALFYGLFTPLGWCLRKTGWDPLQLQWNANQKSFWKPAEKPGNYFKQS